MKTPRFTAEEGGHTLSGEGAWIKDNDLGEYICLCTCDFHTEHVLKLLNSK